MIGCPRRYKVIACCFLICIIINLKFFHVPVGPLHVLVLMYIFKCLGSLFFALIRKTSLTYLSNNHTFFSFIYFCLKIV